MTDVVFSYIEDLVENELTTSNQIAEFIDGLEELDKEDRTILRVIALERYFNEISKETFKKELSIIKQKFNERIEK